MKDKNSSIDKSNNMSHNISFTTFVKIFSRYLQELARDMLFLEYLSFDDRMNSHMKPVDQNKVKDFLSKLNGSAAHPKWIELQGISAITAVRIEEDERVIFNPSEGHLVKPFLDTTTGEVKLISVIRFLKE